MKCSSKFIGEKLEIATNGQVLNVPAWFKRAESPVHWQQGALCHNNTDLLHVLTRAQFSTHRTLSDSGQHVSICFESLGTASKLNIRVVFISLSIFVCCTVLHFVALMHWCDVLQVVCWVIFCSPLVTLELGSFRWVQQWSEGRVTALQPATARRNAKVTERDSYWCRLSHRLSSSAQPHPYSYPWLLSKQHILHSDNSN